MHFMGKSSGETKLFLILGAVILLGGGFLLWSSRPPQPPTIPPSAASSGETPPSKEVTEDTFNGLLRDARHSKGPENADITIVEFGDFECPSCRRSFAMLEPQLEKSSSVRFIFRHLPLPNHERAMPAAIATEAAARQGKFWPMYAALFTGENTELSDQYIEESAQKVGLNMEQFRTDSKDPQLRDLIRADEKMATTHRIDTTPTFIVRTKDGKIRSASGARQMMELMQQIGLMPEGAAPSPEGAPPG